MLNFTDIGKLGGIYISPLEAKDEFFQKQG